MCHTIPFILLIYCDLSFKAPSIMLTTGAITPVVKQNAPHGERDLPPLSKPNYVKQFDFLHEI